MSKRIPSVEQFAEIREAFLRVVGQNRHRLPDSQENKEECAPLLARFAKALRVVQPHAGRMEGWPDGVEAAFQGVVDAFNEIEPRWSSLKGQEDNPLSDAFRKLYPFLPSDQIASVQNTVVARPAGGIEHKAASSREIACQIADINKLVGYKSTRGSMLEIHQKNGVFETAPRKVGSTYYVVLANHSQDDELREIIRKRRATSQRGKARKSVEKSGRARTK
jgi:hypothetical protein